MSFLKNIKSPFYKVLMCLIVLSFSAITADAQKSKTKDGNWKKELQEFKLKYLIQEMNLPADKQKEFVKIYTQMEDERDKDFKAMNQKRKALKKIANPTETDYLKVVDAFADMKMKEGEMERTYNYRLKQILTGEQLYKLKIAEHKFMQRVMEMRGKKKK